MEALPGILVWLVWVGTWSVLMVWAVRDWRRSGSWYVGCIAAGAGLQILATVFQVVFPFILVRLDGPYTSQATPAKDLAADCWLVGGYAFLLGMLFLVIGGLAYYVAYPRLALPRVDSSEQKEGDE